MTSRHSGAYICAIMEKLEKYLVFLLTFLSVIVVGKMVWGYFDKDKDSKKGSGDKKMGTSDTPPGKGDPETNTMK